MGISSDCQSIISAIKLASKNPFNILFDTCNVDKTSTSQVSTKSASSDMVCNDSSNTKKKSVSPNLENNKNSNHRTRTKKSKSTTPQITIEFHPGKIGLGFDDEGYVVKVARGTQAKKLQVCTGWKLVSVNSIKKLPNLKAIIKPIKSLNHNKLTLVFDCPEGTCKSSNKRYRSKINDKNTDESKRKITKVTN